MSKTIKEENYGAPLVGQLVMDCRSLGISIDAGRDIITKLWWVRVNNVQYNFPVKAGVSSVCWFLRGLILKAKMETVGVLQGLDTRL